MAPWNSDQPRQPGATARRSSFAVFGNGVAAATALAVLLLAAPSVWDWATADAGDLLSAAGYSGGGLRAAQFASFLLGMAALGLATHLAVLLLGLAVCLFAAGRIGGGG